MKNPYEFLKAIEDGKPVPWKKGVSVLTKEGIKPGQLTTVILPDSLYDDKTTVQIIDQDAFLRLKSRFPEPVAVSDRATASLAGDSHAKAVTGSMLTLDKSSWLEPRVAVCRNGLQWSALPEPHEHLLLVENLENFLRVEETLSLAIERCGLDEKRDQITLAFGSGNAAAKACNALFYQHFDSVNCLFDVDAGGIQIYQNIKKLLADSTVPVRFLVPENVSSLLEQSRRKLPDDERQKLKAFSEENPELRSLIAIMRQSHRKLEQETYLD
ncbi:hypothetical protein EOPP23_01575 [Endozoicomonas sp. OPT23]|uniref:hypothetical protein n=1 Tax=Endozoicomonas sp. OPT23 TaxID=2072845 RepID=UPI00129B4727|nr:hypothetical protein [Endozoicomonas sp. OPT23]MRI31684.1 hypothetical protein [Endozoicomonas sp. OPT23]